MVVRLITSANIPAITNAYVGYKRFSFGGKELFKT